VTIDSVADGASGRNSGWRKARGQLLCGLGGAALIDHDRVLRNLKKCRVGLGKIYIGHLEGLITHVGAGDMGDEVDANAVRMPELALGDNRAVVSEDALVVSGDVAAACAVETLKGTDAEILVGAVAGVIWEWSRGSGCRNVDGFSSIQQLYRVWASGSAIWITFKRDSMVPSLGTSSQRSS
jgi:hypothetical protein